MNNAIKIALVVVLLGAAGFLAYRYYATPAEGQVAGDLQSIWKCSNESCGNVFRVSQRDRMKLQNETGTTIPACPKCSKLGTEVYECQFCKGVFEPAGHGSYPANCPHCGKNLAGDSSKDLANPKPEKKSPSGHG
ncbi:MAG: hypothetical protein U0638_13520 [Phycisphaerales bacterium]